MGFYFRVIYYLIMDNRRLEEFRKGFFIMIKGGFLVDNIRRIFSMEIEVRFRVETG